jgi:flagellar biosynthesis protein FlhA
VAIPLLIVATIVLLVIPIPPPLLDLLLAVNLSIAMLILLTTLMVRRALDFSVFPALLLVTTLARLSLNVTSTRLILTEGQAGEVIEAFGSFVIGGNLIVGLVVFAILVVIQFAVITSGASRVSEVSARFTLDAMPGKQMAIDADLNAGLIDEHQARARRQEIASEADFYGAMDGASKFVKGDAIAAVILVLINLFAGFAVGMLQMGMDFSEAVQTFSLLSVGDGLVSQIPALLISVAAGLLVTRVAREYDIPGGKGPMASGLGPEVLAQMSQSPLALRVAGAVIIALGLLPGLPKLPFFLVAAVMFFLGHKASQRVAREEASAVAAQAAADYIPPAAEPDVPSEALNVDPLRLDLATDILDLLDPALGDLPSRVKALRRRVASDLGIVVPPLRTADDPMLPASSYSIRVNGVEVARGEAPVGCALVLEDGTGQHLPGRATVDPVFGTPAAWVSLELAEVYRAAGSTVVDRASVIVTHLAEVVRQHAADLLTRQTVQTLLDAVAQVAPTVAKDVDGDKLTLGELQQVLAALLNEGVPVRNLTRILEAVTSKARESRSIEALTEAARQSIGAVICAGALTDGSLHALTIEPSLEQSLLEAVRSNESGTWLAVDGVRLAGLLDGISRAVTAAEEQGYQAALVCAAPLRPSIRRIVASSRPDLPVIAYSELSRGLDVVPVGEVALAPAMA